MAAVVSSRPRDHIFHSVFPKPNFTTPTPEATPTIGVLSSPGRSFGGLNTSNTISDDAVKLNRAWSVVTRCLTPASGVDGSKVDINNETIAAYIVLLERDLARDLIDWYHNAVQQHFRDFVESELQGWLKPISVANVFNVLQHSVRVLQGAQDHYIGPIEYLNTHVPHDSQQHARLVFRQVLQKLHNLIVQSLPRERLQQTVAIMLYQMMTSSLEQSHSLGKCITDGRCLCEIRLDSALLRNLRDVGLGAITGERACAYALTKFTQGPALQRRCFEVDWSGLSSVVPKLRTWVQEKLLPAVEAALRDLTGNQSFGLGEHDAESYATMAVVNLGRLRSSALFDYVQAWPASTGAILDLREYLNIGNAAHKIDLCETFSQAARRRLLHAGASTSEILSIYVNVIHAFRALDARGVLLEKVAVPMRNYLRAREDTVNIIAASFLADVDHEGDLNTVADITLAVNNSTHNEHRDQQMLNWDDMEWIPDPIDAGPEYRTTKSEDVVAYILGLFEQEEFIKEVTSVLAQHLLHADESDYVKETRLVELCKSRLDATKLQAAEVMLKDMRDSVTLGKRINPRATSEREHGSVPNPKDIQAAIPDEGISLTSLWKIFDGRMKRSQLVAAVKLVANKRNDLFFTKRTRIQATSPAPTTKIQDDGPTFKAQILSSFFWPQLLSHHFNMPKTLEPPKTDFESRFNRLGSQRKLHFRPALSRVSMRLDLEDRTIEETNVEGWRASVINAFASQPADDDGAPDREQHHHTDRTLTVEELMTTLNMEEDLVRDALNFWSSKAVLYQRQPGFFAVLERLDMQIEAVQPPVQPEETISAVMSQDAMLRESAPMFETFIANMLRNQGPKQIEGMMGITSLLKMVLPTFTYGDEEVMWLLAEMESRGEVQRNGETWAVV